MFSSCLKIFATLKSEVRTVRSCSFNALFSLFICARQTEAGAAELCDTAKHELAVFKALSPQSARDRMCLLGMFLLQ